MFFGAKLFKIRDDLKLSGEEVAKKLKPFLPNQKVSKQSVSGWESKVNPPPQTVINAYCKAFGISERDLRELDPDEKHTSASKNERQHDDLLVQTLKEVREFQSNVIKERNLKIAQLEAELSECRSKLTANTQKK